eukprot:424608-Alexandrium_andersonii.AAC.1
MRHLAWRRGGPAKARHHSANLSGTWLGAPQAGIRRQHVGTTRNCWWGNGPVVVWRLSAKLPGTSPGALH